MWSRVIYWTQYKNATNMLCMSSNKLENMFQYLHCSHNLHTNWSSKIISYKFTVFWNTAACSLLEIGTHLSTEISSTLPVIGSVSYHEDGSKRPSNFQRNTVPAYTTKLQGTPEDLKLDISAVTALHLKYLSHTWRTDGRGFLSFSTRSGP